MTFQSVNPDQKYWSRNVISSRRTLQMWVVTAVKEVAWLSFQIVPLNRTCQSQNKQIPKMLQTLQRCVLKPKLDQMQVRRLILGIESSCDDSGAAIIK